MREQKILLQRKPWADDGKRDLQIRIGEEVAAQLGIPQSVPMAVLRALSSASMAAHGFVCILMAEGGNILRDVSTADLEDELAERSVGTGMAFDEMLSVINM